MLRGYKSRLIAALWIGLLFSVGSPPAVGQPAEIPAAAEERSPEAATEELIRLLEDDEARERLIARLKAGGEDSAAEETAAPTHTLAGSLSEYTSDAAAAAAGMFGAMAGVAQHVTDVLSGAVAVDVKALRNVALLVAATLTVYFLLRLALRRLNRALAGSAATTGILRRAKYIGAFAMLNAGVVFIAWSAGYLIAFGLGQARQIGIHQSLFLDAFLFIELTKAVARSVLAPRWPALRVARIDDTAAAYWSFWLGRLVTLIGYTFLFVSPVLGAGVSSEAGEALRVIALFTALTLGIAIILQNRKALRVRLMRRAVDGRADPLSRALAALAPIWHVVAIAYMIGVFALWLGDPETALPFVLASTAESVLAIAVGALLTTFIVRLTSGGMSLPPDVQARLPLLEGRLNAFVPNVLRVVRVIVTLGVVVTILQVWQLADIAGWLASDTGQRVLASLISAAFVLLIGGVIHLAVQSWVEYRLNPNTGTVPTARERTLLALFRNAFTIVLSVLVFMFILSELGVDIGPLLAGAGVIGLAIGFGAQKLVQDVINGAFMQFENTMNEGDVVTAAGIKGTIERLTIRSVSLRSIDGVYHVIPFSSVDTVSNFTKHFSYHMAAIGVAYRENIAEVKQAMEEAFNRLVQTEFGADIIGEFEMQGVVELADSAVVVRARIMTQPGKQWALGRAYNELVKEVFDERGIEIPYPHLTLYMGQDKRGNAPPLHIQTGGAEPAGDAAQGVADATTRRRMAADNGSAGADPLLSNQVAPVAPK